MFTTACPGRRGGSTELLERPGNAARHRVGAASGRRPRPVPAGGARQVRATMTGSCLPWRRWRPDSRKQRVPAFQQPHRLAQHLFVRSGFAAAPARSSAGRSDAPAAPAKPVSASTSRGCAALTDVSHVRDERIGGQEAQVRKSQQAAVARCLREATGNPACSAAMRQAVVNAGTAQAAILAIASRNREAVVMSSVLRPSSLAVRPTECLRYDQ